MEKRVFPNRFPVAGHDQLENLRRVNLEREREYYSLRAILRRNPRHVRFGLMLLAVTATFIVVSVCWPAFISWIL